jgi:hypothetical protein
MDQPLARKYSAGSNPVSIKTNCAPETTRWIVALATVLVLMFFGHSFGAEQHLVFTPMWSKVNYDPKLTKDVGKCYFTSFGIKNRVACEVRLIRQTTRADYIHVSIGKKISVPTSCSEALLGNIIDGMFSCYYRN